MATRATRLPYTNGALEHRLPRLSWSVIRKYCFEMLSTEASGNIFARINVGSHGFCSRLLAESMSVAVERVRKFRNRLAHHDSMINVDVPFEVRQIIELAGYIDAAAAGWLEKRSEVMSVYGQRPRVVADTVVVPARNAWSLYEQCRAYVCQAGRVFRPIERIAFYVDREIKPDIPAVVHRRDNASKSIWTDGRQQVFLLTSPGDPKHRQLSTALPHAGSGRGSAFVQRQRYVPLHALETARTTADL